MNNAKCRTCQNRHTPWCKGCEHNFPGLDQFDFYQKIEEDKEEQDEQRI